MDSDGTAWKYLLGIVIMALLGYVGWRYVSRAPQAESGNLPVVAATPPGSASAAAQYPISSVAANISAPASSLPLPPLAQSDASASAGLSALPGGDGIPALLVSGDIIQRIVATVDALPGKRLSARILPLRQPGGTFQVSRSKSATLIAAANTARYASYVRLAENLDMQMLLNWYVRNYPLFQQAYRQMGYPDGHFNDRLIVVVNQLLQTPDLNSPAGLVPGKGGWAFADSELESLAIGQKMMLRLGPSVEARMKTRLRALRDALTGVKLAAGITTKLPLPPRQIP